MVGVGPCARSTVSVSVGIIVLQAGYGVDLVALGARGKVRLIIRLGIVDCGQDNRHSGRHYNFVHVFHILFFGLRRLSSPVSFVFGLRRRFHYHYIW